ncbi:MAG: helix-turn-helix transcriptional regulator [Candidatus Daviesbacteria bacterium]|nr:helix-turn-helix transcriptional regulator [Candidatus Daviesbacteria bacterium]
MNSFDKDIYKLFAEAREKKGLTQAEVAKKAGLKNPNYYAVIERGEVNTSYDKIKKIAEVLGIKLIS